MSSAARRDSPLNAKGRHLTHKTLRLSLVSKFPDDLPPKAEERLFSEVLGRALGNWQHVEGQISSIFSRILGRTNDSYKAANIALNTILSFDTKLSMTHAAVTSLLAESEGALAEWNPLKNRANRRNARRNELAHFGVVFHPNDTPGRRYRLQPNVWNIREHQRWKDRSPPSRTLCEIHAVGQSFLKLSMDLRRFYLKWIEPISSYEELGGRSEND